MCNIDVDLKTAEQSFSDGWADAMNDNTIPLENLWDDIEAE